jgi:hypothetical protein
MRKMIVVAALIISSAAQAAPNCQFLCNVFDTDCQQRKVECICREEYGFRPATPQWGACAERVRAHYNCQRHIFAGALGGVSVGCRY